MTTKVLLVGTGAVGAVYALILSQSKKAHVTAVCRSNYKAVISEGFDIRSSKFGRHQNFKPDSVVNSIPSAKDNIYDFIIVTSKCLPNVSPTADLIRDAVTSGKSTIVLIQNGIGIEQDVQKAFPHNTIISCVAYIAVSQDAPGKVRHKSMETLMIGGYWNDNIPRDTEQQRVQSFADLLEAGKSTCKVVPDIQQLRWQKIMWNATWSVLCTLTRSGTWALISTDIEAISVPSLRRALYEILSIIRLEYPDYPEAQIAETLAITEQISPDAEDLEEMQKNGDLPPGATDSDEATKKALKSSRTTWYKPSMLLDLEHGRPLEVQVILGEPVRRAKAARLSVPTLETWLEQLLILDTKIRLNGKI